MRAYAGKILTYNAQGAGELGFGRTRGTREARQSRHRKNREQQRKLHAGAYD